MNATRMTRKGRLAGAGLFCWIIGCSAVDAERSESGIEHRPADDVVRLTGAPLRGDDIGLVRDFDTAGDTIFLLDITGRIAVVRHAQNGLELAGHIGRRGGGPGEFMQPSGLAVTHGSIAVMDGARAQFFTLTGTLQQSKQITLPCAMMRPSIAPARDGLFVHGGCLQRGVATDTMMAMLAWSADTVSWDVIVSAPRFTTDGSFGSVFGAQSLLTTGPDGRHAFGGGETNCIWSITDTGGRPTATESCPVVGTLYSADPPPELEGRMKTGLMASMGVRWPETLPAYLERFVVEDRTVLIRPFSSDSLVIQSPDGRDLAVAPLEGFVGCKASGCLWVLETDQLPQVILFDRASVESRLSRGDVE